jgi:hypothetical protein
MPEGSPFARNKQTHFMEEYSNIIKLWFLATHETSDVTCCLDGQSVRRPQIRHVYRYDDIHSESVHAGCL